MCLFMGDKLSNFTYSSITFKIHNLNLYNVIVLKFWDHNNALRFSCIVL